MYITPIQAGQRERVVTLTNGFIQQAGVALNCTFQPVPVTFDLTGRAAGMYRVRGKLRTIRYNPYLFARYFDENLAVTIPHEVAHYVVDMIYGANKTRPHGHEWKQVMAIFGADDSVRGCYDLEGVPMRRYQRFDYACACRQHALTKIRHKRVLRGARYHCRSCRQELVPVNGQEIQFN